ncbi:MAG: hypothetical protein HUU22_08895 [Phycisphaerae bacterium]|nr:hypothetical protein [Phycisphaerae bacterium]NUQ46138.1 hypothetical protein [Phycisphaerae bacterium]
MNLRLIYLYHNLSRNKLRTALTAAAVALPLMIYVLSTAVVRGIEAYLDNSVKQLRLAVQHKGSLIYYLPAGYRARIRALDPEGNRLLSICGLRWIGGQVPGQRRPLSALAADHETFPQTFPDYEMTPEQLHQWMTDRQAIIVGRDTAAHFGWKVGDRITIRPSLPPYSLMEFHVVSTADKATDTLTLFFRMDYLQEELKKYPELEGRVGFYFIKCATGADLKEFREKIDAEFAGSLDETRTVDEKTFMNEFISQQFNLPRTLTILSGITVLVAMLAAANTMGMNFRDRLNELASLKAIGFGSGFSVFLIQLESLAICALGGLAGAAAPYVAFTFTPLKNFSIPVIQTLNIEPRVCVEALIVAAAIGATAGAWPAWMAAKLKVVHALRALE